MHVYSNRRLAKVLLINSFIDCVLEFRIFARAGRTGADDDFPGPVRGQFAVLVAEDSHYRSESDESGHLERDRRPESVNWPKKRRAEEGFPEEKAALLADVGKPKSRTTE